MVKTSDDYEKPKAIRIPGKEEWEPFGDATKAQHPTGRSPRTAVIREFMRWYMRRPGATLPKRPDAGPWSDPAIAEHSPPAAPKPTKTATAETPPTRVTDLGPLAAEALALYAYEQGNEEQREALVAARKAAAQARSSAADRSRAVVETAMAFTPPLLVNADLAEAAAQYPTDA
jgi:hypothetical protein